MSSVLALVSKKIFESEAHKNGAPLGIGDVWTTTRYASSHATLRSLAAGGHLFLVTVRPDGERLWLIAVLESPRQGAAGWTAAAPNRAAVVELTRERDALRFATGAGLTSAPGKLAMSLQTPRGLTAEDETLLLDAVGLRGVPMRAAPVPSLAAAPRPRDLAQTLAEVLAAPDDDAPRLVYADQLEEHGDPRGEFVVVQCSLSRLTAEGQQRSTDARRLRAREAEMLEEHRAEWLAALKLKGIPSVFRRGFVESITTSVAKFDRVRQALFRATPLRELVVTRAFPTEVPQLLGMNEIAQLHSLAFRESSVAPTGDAYVAAVEELASSPQLAGLRRLELDWHGLGANGARALASSPHLRALQALSLLRNDLGGDGAMVLAAGLPEGMTELDLWGNQIGVVGARSLADSACLARIERLVLGGNSLGDQGASALTRAGRGTALRSLDLSNNSIGAVGAAAIAGLESLGNLVALSVFNNPIGEDGTRALAASPHLSNLESLDLTGVGAGDGGAIAIAESRTLPRLVELSLGFDGLSLRGVSALASAPSLRGLRYLRLSANGLTDDAAEVLARSPILSQLEALDLDRNHIGPRGAAALASSPSLGTLESIELYENPIGTEGARVLRARFPTGTFPSGNY